MINNLQTLYKADFKHLPETVIRDLEATEELQQLRRDITTKIPNSDWTKIRSKILLELQQLLDIELHPILIDSWKTHQDVEREIRSQKATKSKELAIVNLEDHEIRSTHSPSLGIKIEDDINNLRSFIGITLKLRDVSLVIQEGEILEALSGTVKGRGFMQYQNATLIDKDFLDFDITGKFDAEKQSIELQTPPPILTPQLNDGQVSDAQAASDQRSNNKQLGATPLQPSRSMSSNMIQFIIGISIALIAIFLFWQFK